MRRVVTVLLVLSLALGIVGCKKQRNITPKEEHYAPITVVLNFVDPNRYSDSYFLSPAKNSITVEGAAFDYTLAKSPMLTTKNTPEELIINDINIILHYRIDAANSVDGIERRRPEFDRHYFFTFADPNNRTVVLDDVFIGEYDMYIIANNGVHMCPDAQPATGLHTSECKFKNGLDLKKEVSNNFNFEAINDPTTQKGLLMQSSDHVVFRKYGDYDKEIALTRLMSKLNLTINDPYNAVEQVQIQDIAENQLIFGNNANCLSYTNIEISSCLNWESDYKKTAVCYISSNIKTLTDPSKVSTPKDRNPSNAPKNSTYLVMGKSGDTSYKGFLVYLWDGDPIKDFSILPNTPYDLTVSIKTPEIGDMRVVSLDIVESSYKYHDGSTDREVTKTPIVAGTEIYRTIDITGVLYNTDVLLDAKSSTDIGNFRVEIWNKTTSNWDLLLEKSDKIDKIVLFTTPSDGNVNEKIKLTYWQNQAGSSIKVGNTIKGMNQLINLYSRDAEVSYK